MKRKIAGTLALALAILCCCPAALATTPQEPGYELGRSTERTGGKAIWVRSRFGDVAESHWFYEASQQYRKQGILRGDEHGHANLDDQISAAEVYALFVRYVYAEDFAGETVGGALNGDYLYHGQYAWMDAYETVQEELASTILLMDRPVELPAGAEEGITRSSAILLYALAALSHTEDPVWYLGQFSDTHLGYYARSNAPISTYTTGESVLGSFQTEDHWDLSPLEIQCANMLMYLGVLEGKPSSGGGRTLDADSTLHRAEGAKLLVTLDQMDTSPHRGETGSGGTEDWGGSAGEYPDPDPIPPQPSEEPIEEPEPEPTPDPSLPHSSMSIVLVDWDNTILGALSARTNTDLRAQVSDYARDNLVHPALRSAPGESLERADNYRGEYSSPAASDGADYPLTNKLDYAFVQRPLIRQQDGSYVQSAAGPEDYPYAYGWAVCNKDSYMNTWTTLGVGELASWDGTRVTYEPGADSEPDFEVAQLSLGFDAPVVFLKAIYQPGPDLVTGEDALYRVTSTVSGSQNGGYQHFLSPTQSRAFGATHPVDSGNFLVLKSEDAAADEAAAVAELSSDESGEVTLSSTASSAAGLAIYTWVTYERNTIIDGQIRGVERIRRPTLRMQVSLDHSDIMPNETHGSLSSGETPWVVYMERTETTRGESAGRYKGLDSESVKTPLGTIKEIWNTDRMEVLVDTMGNYYAVNTALVDKYGADYVTGKERSHDNEWYRVNQPEFWIKDNFDYTSALDDVRGTNGRIMDACLNGMANDVTHNARGAGVWISLSNYSSWLQMMGFHCPAETDLGASSSWLSQMKLRRYVQTLIRGIEEVIRDHYREEGWWDDVMDMPKLTWHQLQLYLLDAYDYDNGLTQEPPAMRSPAEADAVPIAWCRLHEACAGG